MVPINKGQYPFQIVEKNETKCVSCRFCEGVIFCPQEDRCIGCMACFYGCPYEARNIVADKTPRATIHFKVDGKKVEAPEGITVKRALELGGYNTGTFSEEADIQTPCGTGGCYSCLVMMDNKPVRSCVTTIKDAATLSTHLPEGYTPKRIVHGPSPHSVGGKATPWWLKTHRVYIEVAIWTAGCNLRCPQCQNYHTTYDGRSLPITPLEAASLVTKARRRYRVDRMAISGGEPTLNRLWLTRYFIELKRLNPDKDGRFHLDSNGTLLTRDYIDELIGKCGVTDIGIEPKGIEKETFKRITRIGDDKLVEKYLKTSWEAVEHISNHYKEKVFLGVGLPYNKDLIGLDEVERFGKRVAKIDPEIQLCALDYFPTFRQRELNRPHPAEMIKVKDILETTGLKNVVVQTSLGHLGPG